MLRRKGSKSITLLSNLPLQLRNAVQLAEGTDRTSPDDDQLEQPFLEDLSKVEKKRSFSTPGQMANKMVALLSRRHSERLTQKSYSDRFVDSTAISPQLARKLYKQRLRRLKLQEIKSRREKKERRKHWQERESLQQQKKPYRANNYA